MKSTLSIYILCWLLGPSVREKRHTIRKQPGALKANWPNLPACHAGRLGDHPTPVGSGRFRDLPKTREEAWACLVPLPLLAGKRAVWHTRTGEQDGEEVALLAQLRLSLEISSKSKPHKRIPFPTPQSLPCAPGGGTDGPRSQHRGSYWHPLSILRTDILSSQHRGLVWSR
jgi:hypothetical protein